MRPRALGARVGTSTFLRGMTLGVLIAAGTLVVLRAQDPVTLRYVANEGMLIGLEHHTVLIDAPVREGIPPYPTSPTEERQRLEQAKAPYDRVDALLITHWHEDHFSAEAAATHLAANPKAVLISSPEVVERVNAVARTLPASRLRGVLPAPGQHQEVRVGSLVVRVLRIAHNPARRLPEQHVGFLIGSATTVLHVGDANPSPDNFAVLRGLPRVDVALLPFWYVSGPANRTFVKTSIAPRHIVALHLPIADAADVRRLLEAARVRVALPTEPGTSVTLIP